MRSISALTFTLTGFALGAAFFIAASLVLAWTGPTSAPPNGNVSAPLNVGTVDQVKDAGLALNALAVFGNAIISTVSGYLNFGATSGSNGYGIRDNAGTMEFKNSGGSWNNLSNSVLNVLGTGAVTQIKFADGTTQTTAAGGTASGTVGGGCSGNGSGWGNGSGCSATSCSSSVIGTCSAGYTLYKIEPGSYSCAGGNTNCGCGGTQSTCGIGICTGAPWNPKYYTAATFCIKD